MLRRALLTAVLAVLVAPAGATAATVSKPDATTLRFEASTGIRDLLRLSLVDANTNVLFDIDSSGDSILAVAPCVLSAGNVTCPRAGITRVIINLKDGDDVLNFALPTDLPIAMTIDGGLGDDSLRGGTQGDVIVGGDGGDSLSGRGGADNLSGGPGFDGVSFFPLVGVAVSLDDQPNDTGGANVHADVEDVDGTSGNDTLIGSAAANVLDAGNGDDTVNGLGGHDSYVLGEGNDTATTQDGLGERVICGGGSDTLTIADDVDEFSDCESVATSGALVRDLDHDGIAKPEDCNDGDPAIRPGAFDAPDDGVDQDCDGVDATDRDRDRDGIPRPLDCDDGNAAIRPGAPEIFANKIDEDCNGRADPLQTITVPVLARFVSGTRSARIARLKVTGVAAGTTIEVHCRGRGCKFKRRRIAVTKNTKSLDLRKRTKLRRIGRQTLEVRLLRADSIGKVVRFTGKGGGIPTTQFLCLPPQTKKPRRC